MTSILNVIQQRRSIRSYDKTPLEDEILDTVQRAAEGAHALTGARAQFFRDVGGGGVEDKMTGIVGDYGKSIHGPHYLVMAMEEGPHYLVDGGYRFEQMVLEATRLGLGTCWIGGYLREETMGPQVGMDEGMRILALTPLGNLPQGKANHGLMKRMQRSMLKSVTKAVVKPHKRKDVDVLFAWESVGTALPDDLKNGERVAPWLEAIRRAPSWANKQPWRFVVSPGRVVIYKTQTQLKDGKDYHLVDCGIAMAHMKLAGDELGISGEFDLTEAPIPGAPADAEFVASYRFSAPLGSI